MESAARSRQISVSRVWEFKRSQLDRALFVETADAFHMSGNVRVLLVNRSHLSLACLGAMQVEWSANSSLLHVPASNGIGCKRHVADGDRLRLVPVLEPPL